MNKLELRMYGLVNYQLTGIQQGIQFGHAVVEYGLNHFNNESYQDWAKNYKTFIILNGGTTNIGWNPLIGGGYDPKTLGTLNLHLQTLKENDILHSSFYEPDLGFQLTSIVFIVDERVFNREKYPDFDLKPIYGDIKVKSSEIFLDPMDPQFPTVYNLKGSYVREQWDKWVESIGGKKNLFLRIFLKNFRLA